ncbi:hypothetical protein J4463_04345 [Candidatus Pacearchaeota archaeon]|nr:hypothetical protein [Candidatus Pacearchaeota archaeon]
MIREREAEVREADDRLNSMYRQSQAQTQAMMIDTDAMVRATQFKPINLYNTLELK